MNRKLVELLYPRKAEEQRIKSCNYHAKKRGAVGLITLDEWYEVKKKYNYTCLACRQQEPNIILSLDHVIPISKGGSNTIANIQPLCHPCNCSKRDKTTDYRQEQQTV